MSTAANTTPKSSVTPERSLNQRMDALQRANEVRSQRASLKRDLKSGRQSIDRLLLDIIDVRDRLSAGLKPAVAVSPRWYERLRLKTKREAKEAWQEGMRMTLRRIDKLLADRRIVATETVGRPFDPRLAAAVATIEDPAVADGIVVEEVRPGFLWQSELLRPAEVIVAKRAIRIGDRT